MSFEFYKTQSDFEDNCNCAFTIYDFIDHIDTKVKWFFKECCVIDNHKQYIVEFSSYDMPGYEDFKAIITATYNLQSQKYDVTLTSKYESHEHET